YYIHETEVINWLMGINHQTQLKDDFIPGYYFMAEVVDGPNSDFKWVGGSLSVNFTAYPFKIGELYEGHDIWDEFNFILDYAQLTDFVINGTKQVTLYNPGISVIKPKIISSAEMQIVKDGMTFDIPAGESDSYDFLLPKLENEMTITGNGNIRFLFRKEL